MLYTGISRWAVKSIPHAVNRYRRLFLSIPPPLRQAYVGHSPSAPMCSRFRSARISCGKHEIRRLLRVGRTQETTRLSFIPREGLLFQLLQEIPLYRTCIPAAESEQFWRTIYFGQVAIEGRVTDVNRGNARRLPRAPAFRRHAANFFRNLPHWSRPDEEGNPSLRRCPKYVRQNVPVSCGGLRGTRRSPSMIQKPA